MTYEQLKAKRDFCVEVAQLKHKAGELGLIKTMHALESAVKAVGWEVAEHIQRETTEESGQ